MIFISHAIPEDNDFARWLCLRLAREGYPVWCELTQLLGGEDFWRDAEQAIRSRSEKFLFVLSRASNEKPGTLKELAVAKQVGRKREDFVIPVKIDDLPSEQVNIELHRLNSVDFSKGWVSGLARLLKKFEEDNVPKDERFSPSSVARWWRDHMKAEGPVRSNGEAYGSNWFKIGDLPERLFLHSIEEERQSAEKGWMPATCYCFKANFYTFSGGTETAAQLKPHGRVVTATEEFELNSFQQFRVTNSKSRKAKRNIVTNLLRRDSRCAV